VIALSTAILGTFYGQKRLLHALILAWFIPVSVMVIFITHFKFQYWLPVALPLISCLALLLPERLSGAFLPTRGAILRLLALMIVGVQAAMFLSADVTRFVERVNRAENEPSLMFYSLAAERLKPMVGKEIFVYTDARVYLPPTPGWRSETTFELLEYGYIQQKQFDVLLLMEQRIRDYLQPGAVGVDPAAFARSQQFYRDADQGSLVGYQLVFRNEFGLIYIKDSDRDLVK